MFNEFHLRYPKGCLVSEFVTVDHGQYIVRSLVVVEGVTLATGLAAADTVELAEDRARARALAVLALPPIAAPETASTPVSSAEVLKEPPSSRTVTSTAKVHLPFSKTNIASNLPPMAEVDHPILLSDDTPTTTGEAEKASDADTSLLPPLTSLSTSDEEISTSVFNSPLSVPVATDSPIEPTTESNTTKTLDRPIDLSDVIARTTVELRRLGWTTEQGRDYLKRAYGKKSRSELKDEQLLEFLQHLESQPTPYE